MPQTVIIPAQDEQKVKLLRPVVFSIYAFIVFAVIGYIWVYAQARYVSTAEFSIAEQENSSADVGLLALALPGLTDSRSLDSQMVIAYIHSANFLRKMESRLNLQDHYAKPEKDFYFRLAKDAPLETRLDYYRKKINAHFNPETGLTGIKVEAFDPVFAHQAALLLLEESEKYVNHINQKIATKRRQFLEQEVLNADLHLEEALDDLTALQNKHNFIDPTQVVSSTLASIALLKEAELSRKTDLASILRESPDSPRIATIESQLQSIEDLIKSEQKKLSGPEKDRLNLITQQFQRIQRTIQFRSKLLSGAELILEKNRSDAISTTKFFTVVQTPFLPEYSTLPRRGYLTITLLVIGLLGFFVIRILIESILERN